MEYRELGNSGLTVSRIGMGCVTFGREIDEATSFAVADRALERGITLFDTADCYAEGMSESVLGKWIKSRDVRKQIVLATKVGAPMSSDPTDRGCSRQHIHRSIEGSLRRLGVECIDLYQVHCWDAATTPQETAEALNEVVRQGKARAIGCSNYAAWQLCRMLWLADLHGLAQMQSVQPPYNLVQRGIEKELIPLCADQNIGIISYSPLGAGFLTGKYSKEKSIPKGTRFDVIPAHQALYFSDSSFRIVEALRIKSAQIQVPMVHLAQAWVLSRPAITSMLIGARTTDQVDQVFAALDLSRNMPHLHDELDPVTAMSNQ